MSARAARGLLAMLAAALAMAPAAAQDLFRQGDWAALASDRRAGRMGDILTVLVFESATAANNAQTGSRRDTALDADISAGSALDESAGLSLRGRASNEGQTVRSGRMVAQLSVTVDDVLPNGDLAVSGSQRIDLNGEQTRIRLRGRVRPADISGSNTVLSSRIADAAIDYDGRGFVSRSGRPGILQRIFNFLGLM